MKVFIINSGPALDNLGDVAMLQVAISRLQRIFSGSEIKVLTSSPQELSRFCPGTLPLLLGGQQDWISSFRKGKLASSRFVQKTLKLLIWHLRLLIPASFHSLIQLRLRNNPDKVKGVNDFFNSLRQADLIIVTGGGYINDLFDASSTLTMVGLALKFNKPVVMFGQGIGPISDKNLLTKARFVLPKVNLIGLREKYSSLPLLKEIGCSSKQIAVTGDDAIELAYCNRSEILGDAIGVNLRLSRYSSTNTSLTQAVRSVLQTVSNQYDAVLRPVPIALTGSVGYQLSDIEAINQLISGIKTSSDALFIPSTPQELIKQVGLCRIVITGSYHAGVFALSQGVPVICLATSQYYVEKFQGLADQFGTGCFILQENHPKFKESLLEMIGIAWNMAECIRPQLLDAAIKQIQSGHLFYDQVTNIVKLQSASALEPQL